MSDPKLYLDRTDPYFPLITKDMSEAFIIDKREHIVIVNKFAEVLQTSFPNHDRDKFEGPYSTLHVLKNWIYRDPEYVFPIGFEEDLEVATAQHRLTQSHHPDYWVQQTFSLLPPDVLDCIEPIEIPYMTEESIMEMCCDWCACSIVDGSSPFDWADKTIGTIWTAPTRTIKYIYETLNELWQEYNITATKLLRGEITQ